MLVMKTFVPLEESAWFLKEKVVVLPDANAKILAQMYKILCVVLMGSRMRTNAN